jgi:glycine C-acetyltransferase
MQGKAKDIYLRALAEIEGAGLTKRERLITTPQGAEIRVQGRDGPVLNFCSNNYLGLSSSPEVARASQRTLEQYGFGMSSVRFICGTLDMHRTLEQKVSAFLGTDDTILYSSCFDANGGLFETLLGEEDAVLTDALNHASIIDGIRLCKAERHRYGNGDMEELEAKLQATAGKRIRMIATDGVFSMEGGLAKLDASCDLADRYEALVMVDDSHATGVVGPTGRGTPEHFGVRDRVDVVTSTLGKALGGAAGGFTSGRKEMVELLRQRSRPYLFSNTVAPCIVGASIAVIDLLSAATDLRDRLMANTARFRGAMAEVGFELRAGFHPIVPIMVGDARLAEEMAAAMLEQGVYVVGFSFPVVPKGHARIRAQLSAAHTFEHIDRAVAAFATVGRRLGVLR